MKDGYDNILNEVIPNGWELLSWDYLCEICYGKDQKGVQNPEGHYNIYGTGGIMGKADSFLYDKPSVLIGRKGTIDKPIYISNPFWTVDTLFYTKIPSTVDPLWFFYTVLNTSLKKYNEATGVPSLSRSNLYKIKALTPPLPEQRKIADILSTVDEKIEVISEQIENTRQLKKGLMQPLLTRGIGHTRFKPSPLGEIPESWEVNTVSYFLKKEKGSMKIGPFGSQLKKDTFVSDGYKVYGQENIFAKSFEIGNRYITKEHFIKLHTCEIHPGDIIISMMGTIGKCLVVPEGIQPGIMDSHLLRLQLDNNKMIPSFLSQLFSSSLILNQVDRLSVGGIMDGLSSQIVGSLKFTIPPKEEQYEIAKILTLIGDKIDCLSDKKKEYEHVKKGMMQKLLTGKIRVLI